MLNPKLFREELDATSRRLAARGYNLNVGQLRDLEGKRKALQIETQSLQNERNVQSKRIGQAKANGEDTAHIMQAVATLGETLKDRSERLSAVQQELEEVLSDIPNIPDSSTPDGKSEDDNVELRQWGTPKSYNFDVLDHVELGERLDMMDFDTASTVAGSRFVILKGSLARLQRALIQFMLDLHTTEHGYTEVYVPYIVNAMSLYGTGQLPKFAADLFSLEGEQRYFLIPTAEVPVTNIVREKLIDEAMLPQRFVAHTPCFRSEAGSYGKDTRGMIRQHQFEKVELVQIVRPQDSYAALDTLTGHAEKVLQALELPYRVVSLCKGDLGFSAAKTYDLEVWLPSQRCYREISSCSNFESFQARRLKARWRSPQTEKPEPVHTVNGSGLAVGRTLVAIMENFQEDSGQIRIPGVLKPYMGGADTLTK
ncbi:MAG TPA: serine--tRNA ligase [Acidiferrobacteraceae bacterium]|nr:serine--tRNA ligase [Acidiferrobacteraceae bacterium]